MHSYGGVWTLRKVIAKDKNLENLLGVVLNPLLVIPVCPTLDGFKVA